MGWRFESTCPHCQEVVPNHLLKPAPSKARFLPLRPAYYCPNCGKLVKRGTSRADIPAATITTIVIYLILRAIGYSFPLPILFIALLITIASLWPIKHSDPLSQENGSSKEDATPTASFGLRLWGVFKQLVCGAGVLLCLMVFWLILEKFVATPSFGYFMGLLATLLVGAAIYSFGFVSWARMLGKE